jgi:hypothetical protein
MPTVQSSVWPRPRPSEETVEPSPEARPPRAEPTPLDCGEAARGERWWLLGAETLREVSVFFGRVLIGVGTYGRRWRAAAGERFGRAFWFACLVRVWERGL